MKRDEEETGPRLLTVKEFYRKPPRPTQEEIDRARREREERDKKRSERGAL